MHIESIHVFPVILHYYFVCALHSQEDIDRSPSEIRGIPLNRESAALLCSTILHCTMLYFNVLYCSYGVTETYRQYQRLKTGGRMSLELQKTQDVAEVRLCITTCAMWDANIDWLLFRSF